MIKSYHRLFGLIVLAVFFSDGFGQTGIPRIVINSMGHSARVNNLIFNQDGSQIISVSEDKTVRIWSAATGEMLKKYESQIGDGNEGMLYASALSPDGKHLAIAGYPVASEKENYVVIISLEKGEQTAVAVGHTNVINGLSFIDNGKFLISGSDDGTIKVWSMSGATVLPVVLSIEAGGPVKFMAVNTVTSDVAVAVEGMSEILVYNLLGFDRGTVKPSPKVWKRHKGEINKLTYSGDGTYLASSSYTHEFFLWKADGSLLKEIPSSYDVNALAFSHDGRILVALDIAGKGVSYAVPGGNKLADFAGHDNAVFSATFSTSETGNYVVASAGGSNNEIFLWNPINGREIRKIRGKGTVIGALAFGAGMELHISRVLDNTPDYKTSFDFENFNVNKSPLKLTTPAKNLNEGIAQGSEFTLDLPRGKSIQNDPDLDGRILSFQGTADNKVIVASDYSLKMYDRAGLIQKEFTGHIGGVRAVTVSADGRYMASGGEDQTIILWKLSETGAAPSLREAFPDETWANFFKSLSVDSLTKEPSRQAWKQVIDFLKSKNDKTYRGIEEVYKNLGETVLPFATLFLTEDHEWVCWTPRGYFACTSSGSQYFGWHINRGINKLADFYSAEQYFEILFKPKHLEKSIIQGKRVEDILREEGERIFDLGRLHRPSAGLIDFRELINSHDIQYQEARLITQKRSLNMEVEIFDGGSGVKEVNIYQNDKLIISDRDLKTSGEGDQITKTYTVDLVNETNEFRVVVVNYQRIESRAEVLKIEYAGEIIATSTLHVMAVGINKYQNSAYNLNYAQPDAKSFVDKLTSQSDRIFKSVNKVEIYDEQATKENILKGFKSIIVKAKPEDVFVFFYAGHGSLDEEHKDADGDSPFYFVPADVTKIYGDPEQLQKKGLSGSELGTLLTQIRSTKQIVLMDACHSGGALKGMNVRAVASDEKAIVQLARSSGVVWIASSGTKQFATEFDVLKHGVFTYSILEALNGKADNGDGKLTVNELKLYMEDRVPELTKQYGGQAQYPTGYIHGNDFPITVLNKQD